MEKGQPLAAKCSEFDYAVQNLTQSASVPTIPVMAARFVQFSISICSLLPIYDRFVRLLHWKFEPLDFQWNYS